GATEDHGEASLYRPARLSWRSLEGLAGVSADWEIMRRTVNGFPPRSEDLGPPAEEAAPRAELRRADTDAGAVADLIFLIEQIDHVEAQLDLARSRQIEGLAESEIDRHIMRQ